jgi:cystathionine gamma-synthase
MFDRFDTPARRAVVLAQEECRRLRHHAIGPEHLLLGLCRDESAGTVRLLAAIGAAPAGLADQLLALLPAGAVHGLPHVPFSTAAKAVLEQARREADQLGYATIGPQHLLLGLLADRDSVASIVLRRLGPGAAARVRLLVAGGDTGERRADADRRTDAERRADGVRQADPDRRRPGPRRRHAEPPDRPRHLLGQDAAMTTDAPQPAPSGAVPNGADPNGADPNGAVPNGADPNGGVLDGAGPHLALDPDWSPGTVLVQAGRPGRVPGAAVNAALHPNATYLHDTELSYGRDGNAGWAALEAALGALDGGTAVTFGSGLAAATAIADLVPTGGVVVLPTVAYYGVRGIFSRLEERGRLSVRWADPADTAAVLAAADGAAMVWVESVANPLMAVADVPAIAAGARARGALTVVDATFVTPLRQRPLELGADLVLHSATKLLGGHSDLLLGAAVAKDPGHAAALAAYRHDQGAVPGVLEAFLALRGLRTLGVRLDRAQASAADLAGRLQAHRLVRAVRYPGLPGDPGHDRAARVLSGGFGSMMSFETEGTAEQAEAFCRALRLVAHATSLGGVESLIERRARWAGDADVVGPTLCRFSVGIEDVEDLWADLDRALQAAVRPAGVAVR